MTSTDVKAVAESGEILESRELDVAAIISGTSLLLLIGSLAVVYVTVRRRRA